ncbi:hypothetical protein MAM1_0041d02932 [Mucor ambiguus]|uniref:Uncharacterized protein n=1 Tax=Mucor ambiguus TaxID=91626 RepID=A0A0C9MNB7_9FUNG|nr:hypothetical protein MAM1_0041d02932 [Mucor ambiguus]
MSRIDSTSYNRYRSSWRGIACGKCSHPLKGYDLSTFEMFPGFKHESQLMMCFIAEHIALTLWTDLQWASMDARYFRALKHILR